MTRPNDAPVVITHHCMGWFKAWGLETTATYHNCFEVPDGNLIIDDDGKNERVIDFCPFCGKESKQHAALVKVI